VRQLLSYIAIAIMCALGAAAVVAAAPDPAPTMPHEQPAAAPPSPITVAHIVPHRAIYNMALASVKNGSNISDVAGRMLFEWRDVCDGWAIQQHMQLHFTYSDGGDEQDVISTELTWEAKDGKSYNFNIRRVTNGQETENYRGHAKQNEDTSVSVEYTVPEGKKLELPAGTLFPSMHTSLVLQNAAQGQKFFTRRVFDGSDEDGSSDISAFISPQRPVAQETSLNTKIKDNPLLADAAWPVHMAFFAVSDTGVPDYEMDLALMPSGIARHMKIDYGDFAVTGDLAEIEALPAQQCQ
jgi:EipB-like